MSARLMPDGFDFARFFRPDVSRLIDGKSVLRPFSPRRVSIAPPLMPLFTARTKKQAYRSEFESQMLAQGIDQIAPVAFRHRCGRVYEQRERWRCRAGLSAVEEFYRSPVSQRRGMRFNNPLQRLIESRGGDPAPVNL